MRENMHTVDTLPYEQVVRELGGVVLRDLLHKEPAKSYTTSDLQPKVGVVGTVR